MAKPTRVSPASRRAGRESDPGQDRDTAHRHRRYCIPDMSSAPNSPEKRYELVDRIAVGGMAEVFRAKAYGAHGFEKTLAIKRILPELARDPEFERRFIAEAKLAVKLTHANVVQVFDFGRFGESLFIAMEYVDGLDLRARSQRHARARRADAAPGGVPHRDRDPQGLDFAHQHGVVHRDVSPSNILMLARRRGEDRRLRHRPGGRRRDAPARVQASWASGATCRPSRRAARSSTRAPTCSRPAW